MALLDLLGRRWTLRVIWELRDGASLTFRQLQSQCGNVSSSVLNDRLRELREARIVAGMSDGYQLTDSGSELLAALLPLDAWAKNWAGTIAPSSDDAPAGRARGSERDLRGGAGPAPG